MEPNMIGAYGPWAASLVGEGPARLSLLQARFAPADLDAWRRAALERFATLVLEPDPGGVPDAEVQHQFEYDGLRV